MRAQRRKKLFAIESFGGKCQRCGYDRCIDALEFHHADESLKKEKPCYIIMRWSWEKAKKELEKCVLLCSNCHRETHHKSLDTNILREAAKIKLQITKLVKPWITNICLCCKKSFSTKVSDQKFCSVVCKHLNERKVSRPSKEELQKLLDEKISWLQLGRMFGVSDNSVRKWAKKYEILR